MKKQKSLNLFDMETECEKEWKDMPEFMQKDLDPYKQITVNFETEADMLAFAKLVNQRVTYTTKSIWYPKVDYEKIINKRYVDET